MKKIVILFFVVMVALSAKAQFYVGGNVALWHNDDADNTSFLIEPELGYNLSEQWAVGATLGFAHNSEETAGFKNAFSFAPYVRYSYYENKVVRLFLERESLKNRGFPFFIINKLRIYFNPTTSSTS